MKFKLTDKARKLFKDKDFPENGTDMDIYNISLSDEDPFEELKFECAKYPELFAPVEEKSAEEILKSIIYETLSEDHDNQITYIGNNHCRTFSTKIVDKIKKSNLQITPMPTDSAIDAEHEGLPKCEPEAKVNEVENNSTENSRKHLENVLWNIMLDNDDKVAAVKYQTRFILYNFVSKKEIGKVRDLISKCTASKEGHTMIMGLINSLLEANNGK